MDWFNAGLLMLLVAGNTTLCVGAVNRIHSLPWPNRVLTPIRHLHELVILAFPILVIWQIGFGGPGLLLGGSWTELSTFWKCVLAACALGLLGLGIQISRYLRYRLPRQVTKQATAFFNIEQELNTRPVGSGPYRGLAGIPFNEQFQLEFTEKTLVHPRLPASWDGLTILHLSDWHFSGTVARTYFERIAEIAQKNPVDLVCFTGDLIDTPELVAWIPETLGRLTGKYGQFYILGNHDWYHDMAPTRACLAGLNWTDLSSRTEIVSLAGHSLAIAGDETPWIGTHPKFPAHSDFRLLLSHTPDNFFWARDQHVDLMLAGHTHGGQVRIPVIGPVFAPSWYGCRFASGTFWSDPTLMHVSRGLSGIHPLRWRCRPEITRLILRADS